MQSRRASLSETLASVAFGFIIALPVQQYIVPWLMDTFSSWSGSIIVTILFTLISIARGFTFRRLFNLFLLKGWIK